MKFLSIGNKGKTKEKTGGTETDKKPQEQLPAEEQQ